MKKLVITICMAAILAVCLTGCGNGKGDVGAVLDYGFPLAVNQKAVIASENLEIKFIEVMEDSRCPTGATCIWAGRVSVKIELKDSDGSYEMALVQPGLSDEYAVETYKDYKISYKVIPYPELGVEMKKEDYRLQLTISLN